MNTQTTARAVIREMDVEEIRREIARYRRKFVLTPSEIAQVAYLNRMHEQMTGAEHYDAVELINKKNG